MEAHMAQFVTYRAILNGTLPSSMVPGGRNGISDFISQFLQIFADFCFKGVAFGKLFSKFFSEFNHFFFKTDAVILKFFKSNITPGGENIIVFAYFLKTGGFAKAGDIFIATVKASPGMVCARDFGDIIIR